MDYKQLYVGSLAYPSTYGWSTRSLLTRGRGAGSSTPANVPVALQKQRSLGGVTVRPLEVLGLTVRRQLRPPSVQMLSQGHLPGWILPSHHSHRWLKGSMQSRWVKSLRRPMLWWERPSLLYILLGDTSWGYSEHNQLSREYFMGHNLQSGIKDLNYNVRIYYPIKDL